MRRPKVFDREKKEKKTVNYFLVRSETIESVSICNLRLEGR